MHHQINNSYNTLEANKQIVEKTQHTTGEDVQIVVNRYECTGPIKQIVSKRVILLERVVQPGSNLLGTTGDDVSIANNLLVRTGGFG